jgi:hypothetical protein
MEKFLNEFEKMQKLLEIIKENCTASGFKYRTVYWA